MTPPHNDRTDSDVMRAEVEALDTELDRFDNTPAVRDLRRRVARLRAKVSRGVAEDPVMDLIGHVAELIEDHASSLAALGEVSMAALESAEKLARYDHQDSDREEIARRCEHVRLVTLPAALEQARAASAKDVATARNVLRAAGKAA